MSQSMLLKKLHNRRLKHGSGDGGCKSRDIDWLADDGKDPVDAEVHEICSGPCEGEFQLKDMVTCDKCGKTVCFDCYERYFENKDH